MFIFFAEDCGLLPANIAHNLLKEWEIAKSHNIPISVYGHLKNYFNYLNTGHKTNNFEIFAYNGGLFKPDDVLDNLIISDDILYHHIKKLADYDFNSEIDVNILGHIFENSLNEIDEIKAQIHGEKLDKSQSKRKKDGVFYTPKYITNYIVSNTIGKLCQDKKVALNIHDEDYVFFKFANPKTKEFAKQADKFAEYQKRLENLEIYREWLLNITICDPACGSGAFLNEALNFLMAEHRYIDELSSKIGGGNLVYQNVANHILENNLFGVDINEESVQIAKLSLWLRTAEPHRKLSNLNENIKCGNSLIADKNIAGEKAFDWQKEFPKVFEKGGFDVVIGNPPYVNAKGENFNQATKDFYYQNYKTAVYQIDTYILFIEKLKSILKQDGFASYIVPNAWLNNLLLSDVRKFVLGNFQLLEIVNTPSGVFADATVDTVIFNVANNEIRNQDVKISKANGDEIIFLQNTNQGIYLKNQNYIVDIFSDSKTRNILEKIELNIKKLVEISDMTGGIKEYQKGKGRPKQTDSERLESKFNANYKKDDTFLPHITGSEIGRYFLNWQNQYLSYGEWLAEPRKRKYFEGERLIIREIPSKTGLIVCFTDEIYTIKNTAHTCKPLDDNFDLKYILALLNSRLIGYYFKFKFSEFDDVFPKAKIGQCKQLPIKDISLSEQQPFIEKADLMLSLNNDLQEIINKFLRTLDRKFDLTDFSKNLQNWHLLSYKDFIKELYKKKIKLSLGEETEWEDYFLNQQQKAIDLQTKIHQTDNEINQRVYELYGLTDEEIKIIEQ